MSSPNHRAPSWFGRRRDLPVNRNQPLSSQTYTKRAHNNDDIVEDSTSESCGNEEDIGNFEHEQWHEDESLEVDEADAEPVLDIDRLQQRLQQMMISMSTSCKT
jgi:hypothetical protein